jgi:hypothetical protein
MKPPGSLIRTRRQNVLVTGSDEDRPDVDDREKPGHDAWSFVGAYGRKSPPEADHYVQRAAGA